MDFNNLVSSSDLKFLKVFIIKEDDPDIKK
jgi:hypothetical protein